MHVRCLYKKRYLNLFDLAWVIRTGGNSLSEDGEPEDTINTVFDELDTNGGSDVPEITLAGAAEMVAALVLLECSRRVMLSESSRTTRR